MEKVSVTLEDKVLREARKRAGKGGLSAFVNDTLRRRLQHDRLGKLLEELQSTSGPIPDEVMEEVRREWPDNDQKPRRRMR